MMRFGKRSFWSMTIAALIAIPVLAVGMTVVVLNPNDYKREIVDAVEHATGRALIVNGPVQISRSLWPTIEVNDVKLANLPGGTRPDIAHAERIEAQLSLPALLWHRIEILRLTLVGPNILLEQVGDRPNWTFDQSDDGKGLPAAASRTPFRLRIANVHVQNGMVTSRLPARTSVVGIRSLNLQHRTDGGPVKLAAVLVYSDNQPFSLQASAQPTAGIDGPWNIQLRLAAFDTILSATGTMTVAGDYDLHVDGQADGLEKLNALLPEMQLPALHLATLSTHITNGPVPGDIPVIGTTKLRIQSADLSEHVPGLKLGPTEVSLPVAGGMATVSGEGHFVGQPFTLISTFGAPLHLDGRADIPIELTTIVKPGGAKVGRGAAGSLTLKGKLVIDTMRFAGLDATAILQTPALAEFRPALGRALPALTDARVEGRLLIPAIGGPMIFKDAKLVAKEGDLAGDGTITPQSPPVLTARLHSTQLDLDAALRAFGIDLTAPVQGGPAGRVIPDTPLPWSALRGPSVDVTAEVGTLTFGGQEWPKVDLALHLKRGAMELGQVKLAMPTGPLAVSMTADAAKDAVPVNLTIVAPGLPMSLIARGVGLPGTVSGTVGIHARLHAVGRSLHELAASVDGSLSVVAVGGKLSNQAFVKLTGASLDALGIQVPQDGETAVRCLGLVGSFSKGVGHFPTIALETTHLQLEGVGQIDFGQETLALKLEPMAQVAGSAVAVPVLVEGSFRSFKGRLNATGLDKLGFVLDAMFGGDKTEACAKAGFAPTGP